MFAKGLLYLALFASAAPQTTAKPPTPPKPELQRGGPDSLMIHGSAANVDEARRYADDFARCTASHNRKQAAAVLALSYGSAAQATAAGQVLKPDESCFGPMISSMQVGFDAPSLVGGMAEFFVLHPQAIEEQRRRTPGSFTWPAQNAIEAFGDCVVAQGDGQVRAFVASRVASDEETAAAQALAPALGQCVTEGQTIALNVGSIRELLAFSLYRHMAAPPAPPAVVAPATAAAH